MMKNFVEIFRMLGKHKTRSILTSFGVAWGIFLLVMLLGFTDGLKNGSRSNFGGEINTIFIWREAVTQLAYKGNIPGRWIGMDSEDVNNLKSIPGVRDVLGINQVGGWETPVNVSANFKTMPYIVEGSHPEIARTNGYVATLGRFINHLDNIKKRKVAVLGSKAYRQLFPDGSDPINKTIQVLGVSFNIVGVFKPTATGSQAEYDSELILIPNNTLRYSFNQIELINQIRISPYLDADAIEVEKLARSILHKRWGVSPQDIQVYGSYNTQADYLKYKMLFNGIDIFCWLVAIGTIISGSIGVGNIMLITVQERKKEFGLRKAIGGATHSIISLVLLEAMTITIISGFVGLVLGFIGIHFLSDAGSSVLGYDKFQEPQIDVNTVLYAIVIVSVSGVAASFFPAMKAARINPIESLKAE